MAASIMRCSALPWIFSLAFFTLFTIPFAAPLTYSDHCASFVPEATPELYSIGATLPFYQSSRGYYSGGNPILKDSSSNTFTFKTQGIQKTDREGVVKVDAELIFMLMESGGSSSGADTGYVYIPQPGSRFRSSDEEDQKRSSVNFRLEGFWSASSGRLCMVGSSYVSEYDNHKDLKLKAVLKLNNVHSSASIANLVTGTLEGLSSPDDKKHHHLHGGFDSISMLMFPQKNYTYSLLDPPSESNNLALPSGGLYRGSFCSMLDSWSEFRLKYTADCDSARNCSPFQGSDLLQSMVPFVIGCDSRGTHVRVLLQFSNQSSNRGRSSRYSSSSFEPKTALVGEGFWDKKKNLMRFDACRISMTEEGGSGSLSAARVEDCSISFSFWYPTVWSIKERDSIVGEIWSKKSPTESGYFGKITAGRSSSFRPYGSDEKYEYSQIERVRALCPQKNDSGSGETYPNWDSNDLSFEMSVETARGKKIGEGRSYPLFVGDQFYRQQYPSSKNCGAPVIQGRPSKNSQLSISYTISFSRSDNAKLRSGPTIFNGSYIGSDDQVVISAEGVYDGATGRLCMIGCRSLVDSMDCQILIKLQFPLLDYSKKARHSIKGSIESTRKRSDPLYFETLKVSTARMYKKSARSIWRLDSKLTIILVSNTLSCIFAALQLFYVRKNSHVVPFASWIMLTILALGHAIPLMLNFEGSFQDRFRYFGEMGTWVHASEVLVRVATLVALLFEFCLLQLTFFRRNKKSLVSEKKALFLSLPLYAMGTLAAIFINRNYCANNSMWSALKGYAVLIHNGFLLPQILQNIFRDSRDKVLSVPFYIGTTLIRILPYGYYLWKNGSFIWISSLFEGSYRFGTPSVDLSSSSSSTTACYVIIPLGSLLFAAIIYLQQRFGGRFFVPRRFRIDSVAYEKVPLTSDYS